MVFLIKAFNLILSRNEMLRLSVVAWVFVLVAFMEVFGLALISYMILNLDNLEQVLINNSILNNIYSFVGVEIRNHSLVFCLVIVLYSLFNIFVSVLAIRYTNISTYKLGASIKSKILAHFLDLSWSDLNKLSISDSTSRIVNDGEEITNVLYFVMSLFMRTVLSLLIISLLFLYNPKLTFALVLILSLAYSAIFFVLKKSTETTSWKVSHSLDLIIKTVRNTFGSAKEISFYDNEKKILSDFKKLTYSFAIAKGKINAAGQIPRYLIDSLLLILIVSFLILIQLNSWDPLVFFGTISIYGIAALKLLPAFQNIFYFSHETYARFPHIKNIVDLFENKKSENKLATASVDLFPFVKSIKFNDVNFRYNEESDFILRDINVEIKKNKSIALVGPSGSGKSTFIDLILNFIEPTSGTISLDGEDIEHKNSKSYKKNFAYVPQKIYFLEGKLKDNLLFGEHNVSEEYLNQIIGRAALKDLVSSLPEGVNTILSDDHPLVSGGQKQCIGLARALIRGGNTMVLDEATSAMDSSLEKKVYESIFNAHYSNVISVTHKPALLRRFDYILVFKDGSIDDMGTYDELSNTNSFFRKMLQDYSGD